MEQIGKYMLSVICAAVLCAIVIRLPAQDASTKKLIQTAAGLFMVFTLIQPIAEIKISDLPLFLEDFSSDARDAAAEGELQTNNALHQSIKQQLESYILDKAAALGASVKVDIVLSESAIPVPVAVVLSGNISPYHKVQIGNILETELGLTGENQIWK